VAMKNNHAGIGCKLKEVVLAGELGASGLARFELTRSTHTFRRGDKIFSQHQQSTGIWCVRSGHVLLWHEDAFGNRTAFKVVGPREIIGYRSLFAGDPHTATAEALSACHACRHPAETIQELVSTNSGLGQQFLRLLAQDRGPPDSLLLRGRQLPLRTRLIHLLLILKDRYAKSVAGGGLRFELPLLRRDIAALLGTRPESVTRAIKELDRDGLARFNGRSVTVPDPARLYDLAAEGPFMAENGHATETAGQQGAHEITYTSTRSR
jgi:CRP-like cAMP-binding protein